MESHSLRVYGQIAKRQASERGSLSVIAGFGVLWGKAGSRSVL